MKSATALVLAALLASIHAEPLSKRFGINAAEAVPAAELAELGVGRVRFENLKWPMVSPAPGEFAYDGSVAPWHVNVDKILADYTAAGIEVLPFLFQTAAYASTAPEGTEERRVYSYPPKDDAAYADFVWQTVARYGGERHERALLRTADRLSGLERLKTVELWNEPNLNSPAWGPWVADMPRYFEMMRAGYTAAKRADPEIVVSHGGFAGIEVDTIDQLATYRYADGKTPLNFTDLINVHYYSGKVRPERATGDPNVDRSGKNPEGIATYEDKHHRLVHWRDEVAPNTPIWLTETGYDTAGPYGITEEEQAARLPRVIMLALAAGVDSVFVYREKGSAPGQHAASGLVRNDGSKKPAWNTYQTLIAQLGTAWEGQRIKADDDQRVLLWRLQTKHVLSAWAVEGEAKLAYELGACTITDAFGKDRRVTTTKGLTLTEAPVYLSQISSQRTMRKAARYAVSSPRGPQTAAAKRHALLFDFGGASRVKTMDLGRHRRFNAVAKTDTFTPQRAYGFEPREAMLDGYRKWIPDFAECDDCRLSKDIAFRFQIVPGRYQIRASGTALSDKPVTVTLTQSGETVSTLEFAKDTTVSKEVTFGLGDVSLQPSDYLDLRWLTLIRSED